MFTASFSWNDCAKHCGFTTSLTLRTAKNKGTGDVPKNFEIKLTTVENKVDLLRCCRML